ncbi:MAG: DUF3488 and transglutaminase-like domain-containing protein, partial [Bifidobacteriaceae bacterium]|nr:DUF3488 and transglutaminase-like domain-containing protein [Bifidobacteriaceae bacterium]
MKPRSGALAALVVLFVSLMAPLGQLVAGAGWIGWYLGFGALVFVLGALGRLAGAPNRVVALIQLLALPLAQVVAFAGDVAWLGVIPNREVVERFWVLGQALSRSFLTEVAPLAPSDGLLSLLAMAGGLMAWVFDWYALSLRVPAATGMFVLLVGVVAVAFVRQGLSLWTLALPLAAYLGLLAATTPGARPKLASLGVGAVAVVVGLAVSGLPGLGASGLVRGGEDWTVDLGQAPIDPGRQIVNGAQPLVDLGRDLRERDSFEVLRYAIWSDQPVYLRLTSLGAFDGTRWQRVEGEREYFETPTDQDGSWGLAPQTPFEPRGDVVEVAVAVKALESEWLPAPYLPLDIRAMAGETLAMDRLDGTLSLGRSVGPDETYTAVAVLPSDPQAVAWAGGELGAEGYLPLLERGPYLDLPANLPTLIGQTARDITRGLNPGTVEGAGGFADSVAYAQAKALENYFHEEGFSYSLDTPAETDGPGGQGGLIAQFLEDKVGYCVHFAAAMTLMARAIGIPARIAVGYAPGTPVGADKLGQSAAGPTGEPAPVYSVGADRLHSWPELHIEGLGWVGFEPTVGFDGRGERGGAAPSSGPSKAPA